MIKHLSVWLLCIATLIACTSANAPTVNGTSWQLRSIDGTPVAAEVNATITFVDGQFNGNGGCNSYGGTYALDNASIAFTLNQMTMMACMGPGGDTEQQYLMVLAQMTTVVSRTDSELVLGDAQHTARLVFARITP
jgi:putative lipoprotein